MAEKDEKIRRNGKRKDNEIYIIKSERGGVNGSKEKFYKII